ncbi:MAG: UbiA family prenyltransferase [Candidatus Latescibacteria bacterium]|nr:UbiA family prenyltransferase [Candidatus Latescibacterota bacterium]
MTRPVLLGPTWTLVLAGYHRAGGVIPQIDTVLTFFLFSLLLGGIYAINQANDVESDRHNEKLFLVPDGHISPTNAHRFSITLITTALCLAPLLGLSVALLFFASGFLGIAYSCPPFRWKRSLSMGLFANVVGYGMIAFAIGWCMNDGQIDVELMRGTIPYVFAVGAVYINTTIPDLKGDRLTETITLTVRFGPHRAASASLLCLVMSIITGYITGDHLIVLAGAGSFPFFLFLLWKTTSVAAIRASKIAIALLSFLLAVSHPCYFTVMAVTFIGTRVYYKKRFGIVYPVLWDR